MIGEDFRRIDYRAHMRPLHENFPTATDVKAVFPVEEDRFGA